MTGMSYNKGGFSQNAAVGCGWENVHIRRSVDFMRGYGSASSQHDTDRQPT
jgi:hypothetical protein